MMEWIRRYLSIDDLWSAVGFVLLVAVTQVANRSMGAAAGSLLASGMLAIFWLASPAIRARNEERSPNARVVFWALVAAVSVWFLVRP